MKKHFFLFSFMLGITVFASAQTAKTSNKLKQIIANNELALVNQSKAEEKKKAMLASEAIVTKANAANYADIAPVSISAKGKKTN